MTLKRGVLKSFSSGNYTASVQLSGGSRAYLDGITVARNLPSGEMVAGRQVAVVFFNEHNAAEAVVIAVYT